MRCGRHLLVSEQPAAVQDLGCWVSASLEVRRWEHINRSRALHWPQTAGNSDSVELNIPRVRVNGKDRPLTHTSLLVAREFSGCWINGFHGHGRASCHPQAQHRKCASVLSAVCAASLPPLDKHLAAASLFAVGNLILAVGWYPWSGFGGTVKYSVHCLLLNSC